MERFGEVSIVNETDHGWLWVRLGREEMGAFEYNNTQARQQYTLFFIRNLAKGLVLKVPYFRTSFYQILVLKAP